MNLTKHQAIFKDTLTHTQIGHSSQRIILPLTAHTHKCTHHTQLSTHMKRTPHPTHTYMKHTPHAHSHSHEAHSQCTLTHTVRTEIQDRYTRYTHTVSMRMRYARRYVNLTTLQQPLGYHSNVIYTHAYTFTQLNLCGAMTLNTQKKKTLLV